MSSQMQNHEFHAHNSPWTEIFTVHCQQEEQSAATSRYNTPEEQQPTHDALADVYNPDDTSSKRF